MQAFSLHMRGEAPGIECEHRVDDGRGGWRWMLTRGQVVSRDAEGRPLRAAGTFLDISERKTAELERERLELQIRQSQKLESLGVFAGGIAHDFNNLLTAVLGNLYLLGQDLDGPQAELASEARHAAERGADLVRRLLTFARPEVERSETVDLDRLVNETAQLARAALTPQVNLVVRRGTSEATTPGSWISLQQVLMNLLINARDAMPQGGTITVGHRVTTIGARHRWAPPELPRGRYHVISVADTGEGMANDLVERIFDPFFTTKEIGRGSGLGLSTALGIARAHGGWLAAESTKGTGSTFRLLLPAE
jgi:signal transduction histidine kinase